LSFILNSLKNHGTKKSRYDNQINEKSKFFEKVSVKTEDFEKNAAVRTFFCKKKLSFIIIRLFDF